MLFHEVPYADWADLPEVETHADWYVLYDPARVDIQRKAHKSVITSGTPQIIHEHDADAAGCQLACVAVFPGEPPHAP